MAVTKNLRHYTVRVNTTTDISTTVTSHPGAARDWIHRTLHQNRRYRHRLLIGLGVQWTPFNHHLSHEPPATLQLCIGKRCLIFQLGLSATVPRILRRLLADPRNTFVGIWNHSDAKKLAVESHHQLEMQKGMPIDLRLHVAGDGGRSLRGASIGEIVEDVLGFDAKMDEEISKSCWDDEELSRGQVRQACVDAFVSFAIGMRIQAWDLNPNC